MSLTFEIGNTIQFTFVSSVQPDANPRFSITQTDGTLVTSVTATQSDSTHYYALVTMPGSGHQRKLIGDWLAVKTFNGSARNFRERFVFRTFDTTVGGA